MTETRKLSTILFADIVGYTSLMQSNEQKAMQFLKMFKNILEDTVPGFDGEIVQYFGDACLLSFVTASQGVQCAIALQSSFQQSDIPIRIGMHLGEVIFTEDNVFGDGVNVASRIESMGVPGGILISKIVRQQIKNKSEFKLTSLGEFEFKNVEEPIEVFAIANEGFVVPRREDVTGKFKTPIPKTAHKWTVQLIGLFFLVLLGFWFLSPEKALLTDEQINSQLAVLPFENNTGEKEFEQLGIMISDWVTNGLMETGETKILSASDLKTQVLQAGLFSESVNKLYARSGIGVIVRGRYYLQGENLYIQANIIDTRTGQIIHSSDPVVRHKNEIEDILYELKQNILGYWQVQDLSRFKQRPPRYEAYQEYLVGLEKYGPDWQSGEAHFKKAYELDTTFFSPLLILCPLYHNQGRFFAKDSLYAVLESKQSRFTSWELLYFKFLLARKSGQGYEAAKFAEEATRMDPSAFIFYARGAAGYQATNYHQAAFDLMLSLDTILFDKGSFKGWIDYSLYMLGKQQEVQTSLERYMSEGPLDAFQSYLYIQVLIETGQSKKIPEFIKNLPNTGSLEKRFVLSFICNLLVINNEVDLSRQYAEEYEKFALSNPDHTDHLIFLGEVEMFGQNWEQAINHYEAYIANKGLLKSPGTGIHNINYLGHLVACYAHSGKLSKADQLFEDMHKHQVSQSSIHYNKAIMQTVLGDHENALQSINYAIQTGYGFGHNSYGYDHHLIPLFDNPTFRELIRVKE